MSAKTILIAHRHAAVRDRFAVALADARHEFVIAETESGAARAVSTAAQPFSLALVDLGLSADPVRFIRTLKDGARPRAPLPIIVFAGTVGAVGDVPAFASMNVGYINEHAGTAQILP